MSESVQPRVVIIGAGFAGLWAAKALAGAPAQVTLVDRANYHTFFPLLYQVGAAEVEPESIAYPVRSVLRGKPGLNFVMAEVQGVSLERRTVQTSGPELAYDYLVVATGSITNYFGVPGAADHAFPLRTLPEGVQLRNHVLSCFEQASMATDPAEQARLLTFVIVGGGPTGVEYAGALQELVRTHITRDYPGLSAIEPQVMLLEAGPVLLATMPESLRAYTLRRLRQMGVNVRLAAQVAEVSATVVTLTGGETVPTATVVWGAGVRAHPSVTAWGLPQGPVGRVPVTATLQVLEHPEVYVAGDLAAFTHQGRVLPMTAAVACQMGNAVARNLRRELAGELPQPFHYRDQGNLAVIGRNAAVAHLFGLRFTGFPAWFIWLAYHLYALIGFRNRLAALSGWALDYLLMERAVRLILRVAERGH